jgi:hypothetical protein
MSSSKNNDLQKDFAADVYLYEAPSQHPHPLYQPHTVCLYCYLLYFVTGKGGGELNQWEG